MKLKWIIVGLIISVIIHMTLMISLGKLQLNLPSFDLINTYLFEDRKPKKITENNQPKITEDIKTEKEKAENIKTDEQQTDLSDKNIMTSELSQENNRSQFDKNQDSLNKEKKGFQLQDNPFKKFLNEKMKFDIYWIGIYAGSAIVKVKGDENEILITSQVNSASFISNFYHVEDKAESKIVNGRPRYFHLNQIEGRHRGNKEVFFDYEAGEIIFVNHIKNKTTFHKGINKIFMDVLSGFFYLRSLQVNLNQSVFIDIFDSDKFATVEVQPVREEILENTNDKKINTIVIKPILTTEGLFKRTGDIFIWITNDEWKIPVKIETKVSLGKIVAELKDYKRE